jgi:superfamily I DNA/RNA helicase
MQNAIVRVLDPASEMPASQLAGRGGEIYAWRFKDSNHEAQYLTELVASWIKEDNLPLSDIAVLVSKQPDLYAGKLMRALDERGIPYRNEQQLQDVSAEPITRLIVDYLSCLFGRREPDAWRRLTNRLSPLAEDDAQMGAQQSIQRFIAEQRKATAAMLNSGGVIANWWPAVERFLEHIGVELLRSISPDYESGAKLGEVINDTRSRIEALLKQEGEIIKALNRFFNDEAVRILTIHKSKGLEFDSVVLLGVENEAFWGKAEEERCAFFVGVSRAKRRLVLTVCTVRETPPSHPYRWRENRTEHAEFIGYAQPFWNN